MNTIYFERLNIYLLVFPSFRLLLKHGKTSAGNDILSSLKALRKKEDLASRPNDLNILSARFL